MAAFSPTSRPAGAHADLQPVLFRVERFEYVPADLLLRLSVRLALELPGDARPTLFVEQAAVEHAYSPLLACLARAPRANAGEWLWRGAFAVPPELASDQAARFAVQLGDEVLLALPTPSERVLRALEEARPAADRRPWPYVLRRGALLFILTAQLCLVHGVSAPGALADGSPATGTSAESAPEAPASPSGGSGEPTPQTPEPAPAAGSGETAPSAGEPAPEVHGEAGAGQSSTTTPTTPAPASNSSVAPPSATTSAPATTAATPTPTPATARPLTVARQRAQKSTAARKLRRATTGSPRHSATAKHPRRGRAAASTPGHALGSGANNVALAPQVVAAQAAALQAEFAFQGASAQALDFYRIPLFLLPIYHAAAAQYGVPWQILAAINEIETDYGSDLSVSSAGAVGWMQFMPATWIQYGVDALDAGYADPYNPVDAIFAAGRYLRAAGARRNLRAAILAYNHSDEYLDSVLLRARLISSYPTSVIGTLTALTDGRLPLSGKHVAWQTLSPAPSSSGAPAHGGAVSSTPAPSGSSARAPGSVAPPSPAAAGTGATLAAPRPAQFVDLRGARNASVVAVRAGRIVKLGSSRKLGKYVVLRDAFGDTFTYAGLGSIAASYTPAKGAGAIAHQPSRAGAGAGAARRDRRATRANRAQPLRAGSIVAQGTVLGHVRVPAGAADGHLRFAIRPAGDSNTIDPDPILANWMRLTAALHPQGARGGSDLLGATAASGASRKSAHTARARHIALSPLVPSAALSAAQWDQLITRIAKLPAPKVAVKPSSAAIPDPHTPAGDSASGGGSLSSGG